MNRQFSHSFHREGTRSETEFAMVKATLANITDGAVLLVSENITPAQWVPRFRLDPVSRSLIYRSHKGDDVTLRVELQFALERKIV